jgi:cytochrome P450
MSVALTASTEHIPPELLRDVDPWQLLTSAGKDAHERAVKFHQEFPRIFFATKLGFLGGVWVPRMAADISEILQDPETFSSASYTGISKMIGESWNLIPVETDPPMHTQYRALLNPLFSPKRMAALEPQVRELAARLIAGFLNKGECNFNEEFALVYPIEIFLRLMGWPVEMAPRFSDWARTLIKTKDPNEAAAACRKIADFVRGRTNERRAKPTDDFTSFVVTAQVEGRLLTEDEAMGMCFLVFIAGLDTVTSSLGFQFLHLARNPEQQARLRANPDMIPQAVEELLRFYSIVNPIRTATKDVTIGEAQIRKGERVLLSLELANYDSTEFENPSSVDLDRGSGRRHFSFSMGPHHCIGSHLARRELIIAVQEWLARVPPFGVSVPDKIEMRASGVFGLENLHFTWKQAGEA